MNILKKSSLMLLSLPLFMSLTACSDDDSKVYTSDLVETTWYKTRELGKEFVDNKTITWDHAWNAGPDTQTEYLNFSNNGKGVRSYRKNSSASLQKSEFTYNVSNSTLYMDYNSTDKQQYAIYRNGDRMVLTLSEKTNTSSKEVQSEYFKTKSSGL